MNELLTLVNDLNSAYDEGKYDDFHISIRKITEYTCGIFNVNHLANIIESGFWDKSLHTDQDHYKTQLNALEQKIQKYIDEFQTIEEEEQKNELRLIESQRLFGNNILHETPNRHKIILDINSLPPTNQIHLLVTLCQRGILNKAKFAKEEKQYPKWERGIEYFEKSFLLSRNMETVCFDFFENLTKVKSKIDDSYNNESIKIAMLVVLSQYDELRKYIDKLLKNENKDKNLNRWSQLMTIRALTLHRLNNKDEAISHLKKVFDSTLQHLPHIAKNASRLLCNIFYSNNDSANLEIWKSKLSGIIAADSPIDIQHGMPNLFEVIYGQAANRHSGRISSGGPNMPIISAGIVWATENIINACSFGFIHLVPRLIEQLIKSVIVQTQISLVNKYHGLLSTPELLKIAFRHSSIDNETLKIFIHSYSSFFDKKSMFSIAFESLHGIPHAAIIKLLTETCSTADIKQQEKLKDITWSLYTTNISPERYAMISYRASLFELWLKLVLLTEQEHIAKNKQLASAIPDALKRTHYREFLGELANIFEAICKENDDEQSVAFSEMLLRIFNSNIYDDDKEYFAHYYLKFGGSIEKIADKFDLFTLWQIAPDAVAMTEFLHEKPSILDSFTREVTRVVESAGYASNDSMVNSFHRISYRILKYCESDDVFNKVAIKQVVRLIEASPTEHSIFIGPNIDSLYHKLCLLLDSDISVEQREAISMAVKIIINKSTDSIIHHYESNILAPSVYNFYRAILSSMTDDTKIRLQEVYKIVFDLKLSSTFSYVPSAFYFLFKNCDEDSQLFIIYYMLDTLSVFSADIISLKKLAAIYKHIYETHPVARDIFANYATVLSPALIEIIDKDFSKEKSDCSIDASI